MKNVSAVLLGILIGAAVIGHALLMRSAPKALVSGFIAGDVWKEESDGISKLKCNGYKAELYDAFVVIYVDKSKEPTWTGDYVLTIPWSKIEHLSLLGKDAK